jgi:hypothetical protein
LTPPDGVVFRWHRPRITYQEADMKATLKELGQIATRHGGCLGIAWRTVQRPRPQRRGYRPAICSFAYVLFAHAQRFAAHNTAIRLRQRGIPAQAIGYATAATPVGHRTGWTVRVPVLTPLAAGAGWAAAPPLWQQGHARHRYTRAERNDDFATDDTPAVLARQALAEAEALDDTLEQISVPYRDLLDERRVYRSAIAAGKRVRKPQPDFAPDYRRARTKAQQQQMDRFVRATRPALWESLWYQRTYGQPLRAISDKRLDAWADAEDARLREVIADDEAIIDILGPWDGSTDQTDDGALARELARFDQSYTRW